MPRKSAVKVEPRTLDQIRAEMLGVDATCARLRHLLEATMSTIRSSRFQAYVVDDDGKRKRNPAFKDLREYEGTLRAAARHLSSLRAEESALLETAPETASQWDEFKGTA